MVEIFVMFLTLMHLFTCLKSTFLPPNATCRTYPSSIYRSFGAGGVKMMGLKECVTIEMGCFRLYPQYSIIPSFHSDAKNSSQS